MRLDDDSTIIPLNDADPHEEILRLGACPFNRFGRTCGEYDSAKYPILSLGFYVIPLDWHAGEFHSPRLGDMRLLGQAPGVFELRILFRILPGW